MICPFQRLRVLLMEASDKETKNHSVKLLLGFFPDIIYFTHNKPGRMQVAVKASNDKDVLGRRRKGRNLITKV